MKLAPAKSAERPRPREGARGVLVCAERGATSLPDAEGWRGYLDDDGEAVMFCPDCAEREFGPEQIDGTAAAK
jgi:hypothetical protein